jgi:ankyrin repeat protein
MRSIFAAVINGLVVRTAEGVHDLVDMLLLTAEYRHNETQSLVDLTYMLYSSAAPDNHCADIADHLMRAFTKPRPSNYDENSTSYGWCRYVYFCLTEFLFTFEEIISAIELFSVDYPGFVSQLCFMSSWFLYEIQRLRPSFFSVVSAALTSLGWPGQLLPISPDFSNLSRLRDLIYCVYEPGSIGDAVRLDDLALFRSLSAEPWFNINSRMPSSFYGCYPLWRHWVPTLLGGAAFFGSIRVFKYLILNGATIPDFMCHFAIASGSLELVRFCDDLSVLGPNCVSTSILYHRLDIFRWLYDIRFPHLTSQPPEFRDLLLACASESGNLTFLLPEHRSDALLFLHHACAFSRRHTVQYLLTIFSFGSDPNYNGEFCMHTAIASGCAEIVSLMLGRGLDAEVANGQGRSCLASACELGFTDLVSLLLESPHKVDVNRRLNRRGHTPLFLAASHGHRGVCKRLFREAKLDLYSGAFEEACGQGHIGVVRCFLRHRGFDPGRPGSTPLLLAVTENRTGVVDLLLSDARIRRSDVELQVASEKGHTGCILSLIRSGGCDVNARGKLLRAPLHYAVESRSVECIRALLGVPGVDVNCRDERGLMPLHLAAAQGAGQVVGILIVQDLIAVNEKSVGGKAPIHLAAEGGFADCVELIVRHGEADVTVADAEGRTALHIATAGNRVRVARKLLECPAIRVNEVDVEGQTALHLAAKFGCFDIACMLTRFPGVDLGAKDVCGWTPLHMAANFGNDEVLLLMLNASKTYLNTPTKDGHTALHLACQAKAKECVRVLMDEYDVDANARNRFDKVPLHIAATYGFVEGVKILLNSGKVDSKVKSAVRCGFIMVFLHCVFDCPGFCETLSSNRRCSIT